MPEQILASVAGRVSLSAVDVMGRNYSKADPGQPAAANVLGACLLAHVHGEDTMPTWRCEE